MNNPDHADGRRRRPDEKEMMSAMFASLVMQQTNMASIFLGLAPHPQTGKMERDLEHAKYFIDQLEMLEAKTRGNLDKREEGLLKQSLTSLRLAFVEAVSKPAAPAPRRAHAGKVETETGKRRPGRRRRTGRRRAGAGDGRRRAAGGGRFAEEVHQEVLVVSPAL